VQPIEVIRLLIAIFLAGYLGRRWELLRQLRETEINGRSVPAWLNLPRVDHLLPLAGGVGLALALFFALRDLGPALLLSITFMTLLAVARAGPGVVVAGVALLAGGFYAGYWLGISRTLAARVAMWQAPWDNAVRGGDQVAHAIWSMSTGSTLGAGLGLGDVRYLPAGHTDLVLAAVGEELGAAGVIAAAAACAVIAWRGIRIARAASSDATFFLAVALTMSLVTPMLVMAAGMLGIVPLTGVATPFLSYGGSAMLANFAALGLLAAIRSDDRRPIDAAPFHVPVRWLGRSLAAAAVVLAVVWARVQVVSADRWVVEPQLGIQADGGQRYQYNPRVLDAARLLPRGAILDRRGVPIAAEPSALRTAEDEFASMRISLRDACPDPHARCHPLGGATFHLLGDEKTRTNWSATNTSYVERDAENALRGFDDRAMSLRISTDASALALRRDYRDLVPLVRHRWEPDHAAVRALIDRPREVRVTIDARLQARVAALTSTAAVSAGLARAAAVVVDAETGELLASVSYPWPSPEMTTADVSAAMLDRARYGLYPPGSTFKLITAAAALRLDPGASQIPFTCARLPANRVGVRIPGWSRPIRDDVLDHQPHGTLTMKDGLVRSCNAYFAQLAVKLGAEPIARAAAAAGISYPTSGQPAAVRDNLPYAGYGQGPVLASPLRLARVAAAIATDGAIREPSIVSTSSPVEAKPFLSEASAARLAAYMREAVTSGTGRLLRTHGTPIAGKTGTAEIDGAPSHAWFVGFAPAGPATERIAFAVLLENAGYGGQRAAELAGQIVSAAASLRMVR
jgi:cell division protein FtsW (lipid II flippase)